MFFSCCVQRGPGQMMPPPSAIPNFSLPPPGFPPQYSSDNSASTAPSAQGGQPNSDGNQELWVETKSADGKVLSNFELFMSFSAFHLFCKMKIRLV
jgi:hypothetical protein